MDEVILDEFYNKVLPEVAMGNLSIDDWDFYIKFKTIINDSISDELKELEVKNEYYSDTEETLIINNIQIFNEKLIIYTNKMLDLILNSDLRNLDYVAFDGFIPYIIDFITSNLWNNATDQDLINPIEFIVNRINFLDGGLYEDSSDIVLIKNIDFFYGSNIEYNIQFNNPFFETQYSFCPKIVRNKEYGEIYELPKIFYGISNNVCYIYAVHGKNRNNITENAYQKKITRTLYKVNKDIEDEYEFENIKDVTPSSLLSITLFLKYLKENNICDIRVIDFLPIRYNTRLRYFDMLIKRLEEMIEDDNIIEIYKENLKNEDNRVQNNVINKFIRNFIRLSYQLGVLEIKSYPKDFDSMMHLSLTDNFKQSDNILNKLYQEEFYRKKL